METLNASQLKMVMSGPQHATLIDVLPEESYRKQHIDGAENVPVNDPNFVERVQELVGDKTKSVIVYCANRECDASPEAAAQLEGAGFTNVYDFEGGLEEWKTAGYDVVQHA